MNFPSLLGWCRLLCHTAAILVLASSSAFPHDLTLGAHEASLDRREQKLLAQVQSLSSVASAPSRAPETCQLTIRLIDSETRRSLPGLVRIRKPDGTAVPLAGLVNRGTKLRDNHPAKEWFALLDAATVPVPQAQLTIEAFSGIETELAHVVADLSGKLGAEIEISLQPFSDAAGNGWFSGNTHLHLSGLTRAQADEYLWTLPRADRLDLVFVSYLERVKADRDYISNAYTAADLEHFGGKGLLFGNGEEHRHNFAGFGEGYGHVMFLNIGKLVRPVSIGAGIMGEGPDWPPLRRGITLARQQGATIIWCHNSFGHEDAPDWLAGMLQALNIFDGGSHGSYEETFYRYLNIGLKVPFSTGTDWFIYDFSRVYARLEQALTLENWLEALAAGRTFISNGPLLEFRLGDKQSGDTIQLAEPTDISILGRAIGRHDFKTIELIHNGRIVNASASHAIGGHFEADLHFDFAVNESGWFALRVPTGSATNEMGETLFAHTSPIYVELDGKPVFKKEAANALVADMESALAAIPANAKFDDDTQRDEVLNIYREAIETLRRRAAAVLLDD